MVNPTDLKKSSAYGLDVTHKTKNSSPLIIFLRHIFNNFQVTAKLKHTPPREDNCLINGTPRGTRTPNILIRSQVLYPIELAALYKSKGIRKGTCRSFCKMVLNKREFEECRY